MILLLLIGGILGTLFGVAVLAIELEDYTIRKIRGRRDKGGE